MFHGTSSLDLFHAERVFMGAGPALEGSRAIMPSFQSPLWIVAQVEGTGHQTYQVRDTVVTYWVNRWEPPAIGGDPPSL